MGKWSALDGKYPDLPVAGKYGEKLHARTDELAALPFVELTAAYDAAHLAKDAAEAAAKEAEFEKEAAARALSRAMKDLGLERCTVNGFNLSPSKEPYPNVTDKAALIGYMIETQPTNLLVHHGTLSALVKGAITGDNDMPPGVDIFMKTRFARTKAGR